MSRATQLLAGLGLLFAAAGCEAIAGIDDRTANPVGAGAAGASTTGGAAGNAGSTTAGASGTAGTGGTTAGGAGSGGATAGGGGSSGAAGGAGAGGAPVCVPPTGVANVRFGNLVPDPKRYAVCFTPMAGGPAIPFNLGASCGAGLAYKEVSALFHVDPGAYAVKLVDGAATSCDSPAIATLSPTVVQDGQFTAIYALGDGTNAPTLKRLVESRPSSSLGAKFRALHASASFGEADLGLGDAATLPSKVLAPSFVALGFGTTAPPGPTPQGAVDANGYLELQTGGAALAYVAAPTGKMDAELATSLKLDAGRAYTVFLVGSKSVPAFPLQLMICDEVIATGNLAKCSQGVPLDVTVDTYNAQLNGLFVVQPPSLRKAAVASGIAALQGDIACVTEVFPEAVKLEVEAAAKTAYPHAYWAKTTMTTPIDDPTDASGMVPPPLGPSCAQSAAKFKTAMDCVRDNCVAPAGSEMGVPGEGISACMADKCTSVLLPLLIIGSEDDKRCWGCMFQQLNGGKAIGDARTACSTDAKAKLTLDGQNGAMILSKYPIVASESYTLPATDFRVSVLRAVVTLQNNAEVDVYCADLTTPSTSCTTRPYTGQYGGTGTSCTDLWNNELILQSKKLGAWVTKKSGALKRRAFVAGEFYSGPGYNDGKTDVVKARVPDAYAALTSLFAPALPVDGMPFCTQCADNPWLTPPGSTPSGESTWTSTVFTSGLPITLVKKAEPTMKSATITYDPGMGGTTYLVPPSSYYGYRTVVRVEP